MTLRDFLGRLPGAKRTTRGWKAKCPAHDDGNPSLSVSIEGSKILIHCFAGSCTAEAIVDAMGLRMSDLHIDAPAFARRGDDQRRRASEWQPLRKGFFKHNRAFENSILEQYGEVARSIYMALVTDAQVTDAEVRIGGKVVRLKRGMATFSIRGFAERLEHSKDKVERAIKSLRAGGELRMVQRGYRFRHPGRHKQGSASTILSITNYEAFAFSNGEKMALRQTLNPNSEGTDVLPVSEDQVVDLDEHREVADVRTSVLTPAERKKNVLDANTNSPAEFVLSCSESFIGPTRDRRAALEVVAEALSEYSPDELITAAKEYEAERHSLQRNPDALSPEQFFRSAVVTNYIISAADVSPHLEGSNP